jgi:thioredoxin 1
VRKPGIVVIDFWASWCGPCRTFAPIFEAASARHVDVVWAKVDTEADPGLAQALQIQAIPTLMVFRDGVLLLKQAGMLPAAALDLVVEQVRAIDMDGIRAELAAPRNGG